MARNLSFTEGEFYHIFIRGVEKRVIFQDNNDRLRFLAGMYYFNDDAGRPAHINRKSLSVQSFALDRRDGARLTKILCWSLMPNHFHLLVQETRPRGISSFMHRLNTSYSLYFNTKYQRVGSLFSGPFKAVHIDSDEQYTHVSRYIHLNPLGIFDQQWKESGHVEDKVGAERFLKEYKWSSLPDYLGCSSGFSTIVDKNLIMDYFDNNADEYFRFLTNWFSDVQSDALDKEGFNFLHD